MILRKFLKVKTQAFGSKKIKCRHLTGGNLIYNQLKNNQVTDAFIYSGGAIMPLVDCFYQGPIKYYINTHEQSAGHAATAYARSSGKTGVCIVTSGPGLTNLVTPMLDAQNDSTPLVVLSGQVPLAAMGTQAFQECPATQITEGITKWSYCLQPGDNISEFINEAFKVANQGKKGVVHLDLPKCLLAKDYPEEDQPVIQKTTNPTKSNSCSHSISEIAHTINGSRRPILYVGQGANECSQLLRDFSENSNIPVTTTIHAMGVFDEHHPLSMEFLGMHGSAAANYAVQKSDCIIALGTRFDDRTTGNLNYYAPEAKKATQTGRGGIIHVDIESDQINKVVSPDYSYCGDVKDFLSEILPHLKYKKRNKWIQQCFYWKTQHPFQYEQLPNKIKTQDVICELNKGLHQLGLMKKTIITSGVGNHQMMASQYIKWTQPKSFITSGSLGVMGTGLPFAIGAQIAHPRRLVLDIDGDGSFNHTLSDLKTVVEYDLPVKIAIMNDGHQSMVRTWEQLFFDNRITATQLKKNPNYVDLAHSFGIKALSVDNHEDLPEIVSQFLKFDGPILCDFRVQTDKCFPLVAPGKALDDLLLSEECLNLDKIKNELPPN